MLYFMNEKNKYNQLGIFNIDSSLNETNIVVKNIESFFDIGQDVRQPPISEVAKFIDFFYFI